MEKGRPAGKYSQAGRVHDLIRLIEARHGLAVDEMAEETGADRRTIYRDLAAIQEAGYPLVSEWLNGKKVYRFLTRFRDVPPINFTLQELMTLYFLRAPCGFLDGTPFRTELDSIFHKVNSVLPPRYAAHMERIASVSIPLLQGKRDYGKVAEPIKLLREALIYQYRVRLEYRAGGKEGTSSYLVDPYSLIFHKGGLYLLGFAHNRQALRTFAAERIAGVELEKERFEIPAEFRPDEQFGSAFGIVHEAAMQVRVKFSATIAHSVRDRLWHPSQGIEELPDGGIVLSFAAGGKMEIISWLLSYGEHAEVLAPAELREEVARQVSEMAGRYGVNA
ncbi:MAG TPA: transcriptional regulator [Geobacteraceae bacterium]|nr:transcriptional regulator [Geobacteraceae bacterium]